MEIKLGIRDDYLRHLAAAVMQQQYLIVCP